MAILARFKNKIAFGRPNGCDEWIGAKNGKGYGRFMLNKRNRFAHNVAWELSCGQIPEGLHVLHRCDNPSCVNPAHLFLGTIADNNADTHAKGRINPSRGEGHPKAKLRATDIPYIRSSTMTNTELARRYGVTRKAISLIREGVNWRHT